MNAYFVDGTSHAYTVFVENSSQTNNTLQPKDPTVLKTLINAAGGFGNNGFFYDFTTPQTCGLKFDDLLVVSGEVLTIMLVLSIQDLLELVRVLEPITIPLLSFLEIIGRLVAVDPFNHLD